LSSVSSKGKDARQKVVADVNSTNGVASGKAVNVKDLGTFPPNSSWLVTYPSSGDLTLDSQNPDTFVKWRLIRLPKELEGQDTAATAFVAFSEVCVHLWCSPNYDPEKSTNKSDETYQCPCHGSIYRLPDALSIAGPAHLQVPPTNAEPMLTLTADSDGQLYIEPPIWDVDHNGLVGYGRNYESYYSYIKPAAQNGTVSTTSTSSSTT
jgi:rieske iron-sulfur protein